MTKLSKVSVSSVLITIIILFSVLACSKRAPQDTVSSKEKESKVSLDSQNQQADIKLDEKELKDIAAKIDKETKTDIGSKALEFSGGGAKVTEEDLKNLTKFGPFRFPDSKLVTEKSFHQVLGEGTEIYRLEFGTPTAIEEVSKWFRENLEKGFKETTGKLGDGATYSGFEYIAPDKSWVKTVTLRGYPSQPACTILVSLRLKGNIPEKKAVGG